MDIREFQDLMAFLTRQAIPAAATPPARGGRGE